MIPSDHFVLFYNEIFKYLDSAGDVELERYYQRVADRQSDFVMESFRRDGLKGMYDYYCRIRIEENCDMEIDLESDHLRLKMNRCPSLAKAMESDAGASPKYCDHCPGWCLPVCSAAGFWEVFDLVGREVPECEEWIYADREACVRKYGEVLRARGSDLVRTNLGV